MCRKARIKKREGRKRKKEEERMTKEKKKKMEEEKEDRIIYDFVFFSFNKKRGRKIEKERKLLKWIEERKTIMIEK